MKLNRTFAGPAEMPATIPLFPLAGALLLPRRPIQLTVFEPRYLEMLDDALSGERLIGVIQPSSEEKTLRSGAGTLSARLRRPRRSICGDRRRPLFPDADGRRALPPDREEPSDRPYRTAIPDFSPFAEDFLEGAGEAAVDREDLIAALETLRRGQRDQGGVERHQEGVERGAGQRPVDDEPVRSEGEAGAARGPDLKSRAEMLVAITTIELARGQDAATPDSLEHGAFRRNRRCEERSDEAIQGSVGCSATPGSPRRSAPRDDGDGHV